MTSIPNGTMFLFIPFVYHRIYEIFEIKNFQYLHACVLRRTKKKIWTKGEKSFIKNTRFDIKKKISPNICRYNLF